MRFGIPSHTLKSIDSRLIAPTLRLQTSLMTGNSNYSSLKTKWRKRTLTLIRPAFSNGGGHGWWINEGTLYFTDRMMESELLQWDHLTLSSWCVQPDATITDDDINDINSLHSLHARLRDTPRHSETLHRNSIAKLPPWSIDGNHGIIEPARPKST